MKQGKDKTPELAPATVAKETHRKVKMWCVKNDVPVWKFYTMAAERLLKNETK